MKVTIGNLPTITPAQVNFQVRGTPEKVWMAKEGSDFANYNIKWQGASLNYLGPIQVKAVSLDNGTARFILKRMDYQGEYTLTVENTTIQVTKKNTVKVKPAIEFIEIDKDGEIELDLPVSLKKGLNIMLYRPGFDDTPITVDEHTNSSEGRFLLDLDFDPQGRNGLDTPARVHLELTLGEKKYTSSAGIDTGWKLIQRTMWKYEQ